MEDLHVVLDAVGPGLEQGVAGRPRVPGRLDFPFLARRCRGGNERRTGDCGGAGERRGTATMIFLSVGDRVPVAAPDVPAPAKDCPAVVSLRHDIKSGGGHERSEDDVECGCGAGGGLGAIGDPLLAGVATTGSSTGTCTSTRTPWATAPGSASASRCDRAAVARSSRERIQRSISERSATGGAAEAQDALPRNDIVRQPRVEVRQLGAVHRRQGQGPFLRHPPAIFELRGNAHVTVME